MRRHAFFADDNVVVVIDSRGEIIIFLFALKYNDTSTEDPVEKTRTIPVVFAPVKLIVFSVFEPITTIFVRANKETGERMFYDVKISI